MKRVVSFCLCVLLLTFTACNNTTSNKLTSTQQSTTEYYAEFVENLPDYNVSENFTWQDFVDLHKDDFRPEIFYSDYFQYYFHHGANESGENYTYRLKSGTSGDFKYSVYENNKILITEYTGNGTHVTIPDIIDGYEVIALDNGVFEKKNSVLPFELKNRTLKSVTMGDNIVYIGSAFRNCTSLETVKISKNIIALANSFDGCKKLKEIELPESLRSICGAFKMCHSLKKVIIPPNVEELSGESFLECLNLESVTLSPKIKIIERDTFLNCKKLYELIIPENTQLKIVCENSLDNTKIDINIFESIDGVSIRKEGEVDLNSPPIYTYNFSQ